MAQQISLDKIFLAAHFCLSTLFLSNPPIHHPLSYPFPVARLSTLSLFVALIPLSSCTIMSSMDVMVMEDLYARSLTTLLANNTPHRRLIVAGSAAVPDTQ